MDACSWCGAEDASPVNMPGTVSGGAKATTYKQTRNVRSMFSACKSKACQERVQRFRSGFQGVNAEVPLLTVGGMTFKGEDERPASKYLKSIKVAKTRKPRAKAKPKATPKPSIPKKRQRDWGCEPVTPRQWAAIACAALAALGEPAPLSKDEASDLNARLMAIA